MRHQMGKLSAAVLTAQHYRRRKTTQQGRHGRRVDFSESPFLGRFGQRQHATMAVGTRLASQAQRQLATLAVKQRQRDRNMKRQFVDLPRCYWTFLRKAQGVSPMRGIVAAMRRDYRCAGLTIPTFEALE